MRTFSLGAIWAVPNAANPTPIPVASLKGFKYGLKQEKKKFRGNQLDVVDVGNGSRDHSVEIDSADFRASAFGLLTGGTSTTGANLPAIAEQGTIPTTPFQITVANSATFAEDGGVLDLTAGKWLTRGATATATGIYAVAAGVYTFNTADVGHIVLITYGYTSATAGLTSVVNNAIQGQSVPFKLRVYNPWVVNGSTRLVGLDFASVHFEEFSLDGKVEDFAASGLKGFASQDMIGSTLRTLTFWSSELG